jgi:hypothetical protein
MIAEGFRLRKRITRATTTPISYLAGLGQVLLRAQYDATA